MDQTLSEIDRKIGSLEAELSMSPLYQRLRELKDLRDKLAQNLDEAKKLLGGEPSPRRESDVIPAPAKPRRSIRKRRLRPSRTSPTAVIVGVSCRIIGQYGKPMPLGQLYDELQKSGIVIGGTDPKANLSTKLSSAKDKLYNEKNLGWWLTARRSEVSKKQESLANGIARLF